MINDVDRMERMHKAFKKHVAGREENNAGWNRIFVLWAGLAVAGTAAVMHEVYKQQSIADVVYPLSSPEDVSSIKGAAADYRISCTSLREDLRPVCSKAKAVTGNHFKL